MNRYAWSFVGLLLVVAVGQAAGGDEVVEPETPLAGPPAIHGRVLDPDGAPLADAVLRFRPDVEGPDGEVVTVVSESDGTFRVEGLEGERFVVRVEADGLAPTTAANIPAGASVVFPLERGFEVTGRVITTTTGEPVPGAEIVGCDHDAEGFGNDACRGAISSDEGVFRLEGLPEGTVSLDVLAPGFARGSLDDLPVPSSSVAAYEVFLAPGGNISGKVVDDSNAPVADAAVSLRLRDGRLERRWRSDGIEPQTTGDDGRFSFDGVPVGTYRVAVTHDDYAATRSETVSVEAEDDIADLDVVLHRGAALTARVVDEDDRPVSIRRIQLAEGEPGPRRRRGRFGGAMGWIEADRIETGDEGRLRVDNLEPGTYVARLEPDGFQEIERAGVRLVDGETLELGVLVALPGRSVTGRVTDPAAAPIADAEVTATWFTEGRFARRTAGSRSDGTYRLSGLGDDPLRDLRASAKGFASEARSDVEPDSRDVDFVLEPTGSIVGTVRLADGTAPPAFRVETHAEAAEDEAELGFRRFRFRSSEGELMVDPTGSFRLDDVEPGTVTVEATAPGFAPARSRGLRVDPGQITDAGTLVLSEGRKLRGCVVSAADESGVPGATIQIASLSGARVFRISGVSSGATAFSAVDGSFEIPGLEAGARSVVADHPDFSRVEVRVEIPAEDDPPELTLRLSRGGAVTGIVRNADGLPVPDVAVIATSGGFGGGGTLTATTDAEGRFLFERLTPGRYQIARVPESGRMMFGAGMKSAVVVEGETVVIDLEELHRINLSGRVVRGAEPVPEALLIFSSTSSGGPSIGTAESDGEGTYRVGLDEPGTYHVIVTSLTNRGSRSSTTLEVPDRSEVVLDVVLRKTRVSGIVTDEDGQPVSGARVTASGDDATPDPMPRGGSFTDSTGAYVIDGLGPGVYRLTVTAAGYQSAEAYPVEVSDALEARSDFELKAGGLVRGRVIDPHGAPVDQAMVFVMPQGDSDSGGRPVMTDVNGAFVASAPTDGPVDVLVSGGGWAPALESGLVPDGDGEIVIRMSRGGNIDVQVVTSDGAPVPGVQVVVSTGGPRGSMWMFGGGSPPPPTDANGTTTATLLAPGVYSVGVLGHDDVDAVEVPVEEGSTASARLTLP